MITPPQAVKGTATRHPVNAEKETMAKTSVEGRIIERGQDVATYSGAGPTGAYKKKIPDEGSSWNTLI